MQKIITSSQRQTQNKMRKIIKNINLPQSFQQVQMFLQNNKMIIVAQRYLNNAMPYKSYFIDKNTKTTVIVYDITDPSKSKVLKTIFSCLNIIKIPFPNLELSEGKLKFNAY